MPKCKMIHPKPILTKKEALQADGCERSAAARRVPRRTLNLAQLTTKRDHEIHSKSDGGGGTQVRTFRCRKTIEDRGGQSAADVRRISAHFLVKMSPKRPSINYLPTF